MIDEYCKNNNIKLIHSSASHPQTNGAYEVAHKEIRKYFINEFIKKKNNFNLENELLKITKIHNNKLHFTTGRIPKEIRDLDVKDEIDLINKNIIKTLSKMNKNIDKINFNDKYVIDSLKIKINKNKIIEKYVKYPKQKK